jgi:GAF domain-containing protein
MGKPDNSSAWNDDDIQSAGIVLEQLGIALESSRLFEETTSRAEREQMVTEITTKIRSTTDPQHMLETAIEELKQILGTENIRIKPITLPQQQDSGQDRSNTTKQSRINKTPNK